MPNVNFATLAVLFASTYEADIRLIDYLGLPRIDQCLVTAPLTQDNHAGFKGLTGMNLLRPRTPFLE
jgi:hypothetical protein